MKSWEIPPVLENSVSPSLWRWRSLPRWPKEQQSLRGETNPVEQLEMRHPVYLYIYDCTVSVMECITCPPAGFGGRVEMLIQGYLIRKANRMWVVYDAASVQYIFVTAKAWDARELSYIKKMSCLEYGALRFMYLNKWKWDWAWNIYGLLSVLPACCTFMPMPKVKITGRLICSNNYLNITVWYYLVCFYCVDCAEQMCCFEWIVCCLERVMSPYWDVEGDYVSQCSRSSGLF